MVADWGARRVRFGRVDKPSGARRSVSVIRARRVGKLRSGKQGLRVGGVLAGSIEVRSDQVGQSRFEEAFNPATVHVEDFEDQKNLFHVQVIVDRPVDDIEVFMARFESPDDRGD